jgi:hypothetical protein
LNIGSASGWNGYTGSCGACPRNDSMIIYSTIIGENRGAKWFRLTINIIGMSGDCRVKVVFPEIELLPPSVNIILK